MTAAPRTPEARLLSRFGMTSAALFYAFKNDTMLRRVSRVTRLHFERTPLPPYEGTHFHPGCRWAPSLPGDDPDECGLKLDFGGRFLFDGGAFRKVTEALPDPFEQRLLQRIARDMGPYHANPQTSRYAHGGMHWVMNFPRLLGEGLLGYRERIVARAKRAASASEQAFCAAMLDTVDGLITLGRRCHAQLLVASADGAEARLARLQTAFEQVPLHPARSFFEALTAAHLLMHLGGGEPGRLDQYLLPYYEADLAAGVLTREAAAELLDEHFAMINEYVGSPGAWHLTIGGSDAAGAPVYNDLTAMCLELNRRYRQPNTSLRVRPDMPDRFWDMVLGNLQTGCGNPALVNEDLYAACLAAIGGVDPADICDFGFGGCTETLVQGKSAVDSIGSTYNLLDILEATVARRLPECESFAAFMAGFNDDVRLTARQLVEEVNLRQQCYGLYWTDPVRTLLTDDCIERCKGYHEGGCRYNFEIVVVYGIANTINSLHTIRRLYDGGLQATREELLDALAQDYEGREVLLARIRQLEKFGNNDPEVNALAREVTRFVFDEIRQARCWRGAGRFLPASIGWTDFITLGLHLGATPDGRRRGEPLADSTGPTQGTDRRGPTETLLSTAAVAQDRAPGTCVLNLMLDPKSFDAKSQREKLKALFRTYFAQGGCQLQVNVVDDGVLQDAMQHPEKHAGLFVRVAGYNDYFVKQTREIQEEILERSRHRVAQ